eukprot:scaffold193022_cov48-Prasinocladus_malaysianus.AAC.1
MEWNGLEGDALKGNEMEKELGKVDMRTLGPLLERVLLALPVRIALFHNSYLVMLHMCIYNAMKGLHAN